MGCVPVRFLVTGAVLATAHLYTSSAGAEDQLKNNNVLQRKQAYENILKARRRQITKLIRIVDTEKDTSYESPFYLAIETLGDLRAEEAVGTLARKDIFLYIPEGFEEEDEMPREALHRAAFALARIGGKASGAMRKKILRSKDDSEIKLAAWVLARIHGRDTARAKLEQLQQRHSSANGVKVALQSLRGDSGDTH